MKKIISTSILMFITCPAFAGGSGGGGVRPGMESFNISSVLDSSNRNLKENVFDSGGSSGGGVGPRPMQVDYVNAIAINDDGQVKFKYKGFDSSEVQLHSLNLNEIADKYIEAIKRSKDSQNWEAVPVEGLGN